MEPNRQLTSVQQCVAEALASGATITAAADANNVHRVTVYRWMKTLPEFQSTLRRVRAEFLLAYRDEMHDLSGRAHQTLFAILDNPKSSPAVLLRASMFILQRPRDPKTAWNMPEQIPTLDADERLDATLLDPEPEPENPVQDDDPAQSVAYDPDPSTGELPCNTMQHQNGISEDDASQDFPPDDPDVDYAETAREDDPPIIKELFEEFHAIDEYVAAQHRKKEPKNEDRTPDSLPRAIS